MAATVQSTVLTIDDLAQYLKISKSTLYKLAQEGAVPGQKVGRHWRFHREAVDQWLRKEPATGKKKQIVRKPVNRLQNCRRHEPLGPEHMPGIFDNIYRSLLSPLGETVALFKPHTSVVNAKTPSPAPTLHVEGAK